MNSPNFDFSYSPPFRMINKKKETVFHKYVLFCRDLFIFLTRVKRAESGGRGRGSAALSSAAATVAPKGPLTIQVADWMLFERRRKPIFHLKRIKYLSPPPYTRCGGGGEKGNRHTHKKRCDDGDVWALCRRWRALTSSASFRLPVIFYM